MSSNAAAAQQSQKRKLTLDLANPTVIKKSRLSSLQTPVFSAAEILSSPDFKNIATPELDFAMRSLFPDNNYSPIAKQVPPPVYYQSPQNQTYTVVTTASSSQPQQLQPLAQQHYESDSSQSSDTNSSMASGNAYMNNGTTTGKVVIKQEHPIDMETQEKIKLERKRMRNRLAASKCRKRKLEKISKLEDKVAQLKKENLDLENVLEKLKTSVSDLRSEVQRHADAGCQIMIAKTSSGY